MNAFKLIRIDKKVYAKQLGYVRHNNFSWAKRSMGSEGID